MLDWLEHSNSPIPSRDSSPARIRRAIDAWHATLHRHAKVEAQTALPKCPEASSAIPGILARAITTVGQLVAEGVEMHHCVAAFAEGAINGEVHIYSAEVLGARATIAITGRDGRWRLQPAAGWRLLQAAGLANRQLDRAQMAVVERWIGALS